MDILGLAESNIQDNDIIVGKCNYSGTVMSTTFDYFRRGIVPTETFKIKKTYDITDATDIVIALPDAITSKNYRIYQRTGAGAGKVTFTTTSSQTINGNTPDKWDLTDDGEIITLKPDDGNWIVINSYGNSWQSDISSTINRNFIENALKEAIKKLVRI